jgi:hypothetical protein
MAFNATDGSFAALRMTNGGKRWAFKHHFFFGEVAGRPTAELASGLVRAESCT